ncbi:MAG TPA: polyphosphate kinase 2 [Anaerolineales bacterium]|nr:polyphosphate kinase 2 [Anaerolineales bacterium]
MGKKQGKKNKGKKQVQAEPVPAMAVVDGPGDAAVAIAESGNGKAKGNHRDPNEKMTRKAFEKELEPLEIELVKMQDWVKATGAKVCVIFEGRDTAGKGGVIKCITARVSPRVFRVVALGTPTEREKSQMYFQRYMPHLPAAGEVVLFDRSWYNRAGVERVMGFATKKQVDDFLKFTPPVERAIIGSGIILIKYWLEVGKDEQAKRFRERKDDSRKTWKLSPMDLEAQARWYDYSRARDAMFAVTDTPESPWYVVPSEDQRRARLNCIAHLLSVIPYEEVNHEKIKFPEAQEKGKYVEPDYPYRYVPAKY